MYNGCVWVWMRGWLNITFLQYFVLLLFVCWVVGGVGEWVDWIYVQVAVMSIIKIVFVCNN